MNDSKSILVVDDHPEHLYYFRRVLGGAGYRVLESSSSQDAVDQAFDARPDLVILDLVLPHASGWEIAHILKGDKRTEKTPILLVTAFPTRASDAWTSDEHCDALLVKPVEPKRLLDEVARWV